MDWLDTARSLAVVAGLIIGALAVAATLVVGAMCWLLNHPVD
jgi:hypothetical protein